MVIQDEIDKGVLYALENLNPDMNSLYEETSKLNMDEYISNQRTKAVALGAGTAAIPGMHLAGMAADIVALFKLMCDTSYGIGSISSNQKNIGINGIDEFDFVTILTRWGGDYDAINAMNIAVAGAKSAGAVVGGQIASHIAVALLPKPIIKILVKIIAKKIGLKFAGKGLAGFIPFLGPTVSAGINWWIFDSMMDEAKKYYQAKAVAVLPVSVIQE